MTENQFRAVPGLGTTCVLKRVSRTCAFCRSITNVRRFQVQRFLICTCPPLRVGALWPMPAWVWTEVLSALNCFSRSRCGDMHMATP